MGPKGCPEISSHFHSSFKFSFFFPTYLQFLFPPPHSKLVNLNSISIRKQKQMGECPKAPTMTSAACLYLSPNNLPFFRGEFSVLLSKAKTSISSHRLKGLNSNSLLSILHHPIFPPHRISPINTEKMLQYGSF